MSQRLSMINRSSIHLSHVPKCQCKLALEHPLEHASTNQVQSGAMKMSGVINYLLLLALPTNEINC